jgi:hypothetical protein
MRSLLPAIFSADRISLLAHAVCLVTQDYSAMEKLVSVIRQPERMVALISRPKYKFKLSLDQPAGNTPAQLSNFYETIECPLTSVSIRLYPDKEQLLASWQYLSNVTALNAETLFHTLVILIETQLNFSAGGLPIPALNFNGHGTASAYSPAHRRTKKRPLRPSMPEPLNFCTYLCDRKSVKVILQNLSQYWQAALELLREAGYETSALSAIGGNKLHLVDLYYAYHHSSIAFSARERLPQAFIKYLLPLLKGLSWHEVRYWLAIYWGLSLDKRKVLLITIMRLLVLSRNRTNIFRWCEIIAFQPKKRQGIFATLLIKSGAYIYKADRLSHEIFERFNNVTSISCYSGRLYFFLLGLKKGITADYLLAGFQLANRYNKDFRFAKLNDCPSFPLAQVEDLIDYIKSSKNYYEKLPLVIWERCGELAGFSDLISDICWKKLSVEIAYKFLRLFIDFIDHDVSGHELRKKWLFVRTEIREIGLRLFLIEKDYQEKFIEWIYDFTQYWDSVEELRNFLPAAYVISARLCRPPFKKKNFSAEAISYFIYRTPADVTDRFLAAPDKSFLTLEKVCRSSNTDKLIANGIATMMKYLAQFTVDCFIHSPKRLLQVVKSLGCLKQPARNVTIIRFKDRETTIGDPGTISVNGAVDCRESKLARLEAMIMETLQGSFHITENCNKSVFSLQVLQLIDANIRPFKRFLKAFFSGKRDYILSHPVAQIWMQKHSEIDIELWSQGIEYTYESDYYGKIRIGLEKDPLEALKLGEYVGSCLGLGGAFIFSAAAVVLDINKQVIYARNSKNVVIARQLVAISEEKKLVCFEIYPINNDIEIKTIFRKYDISFARALGIKFFDGNKGDEGYTVENILSEEWWDDGAWDLTV